MSPPDDTPLVARLARWSEWWFTPRWRALLTWVALTCVGAAVPAVTGSYEWEIMTGRPIDYLNRVLPAPLPSVFYRIALGLPSLLLLIWFQPLALRLSLLRGLAWIGILLVAEILKDFVYSYGYDSEWTDYAINCGSAALQCWVLWGWRSRPWMCLPALAAASGLSISASLLHLDPPHLLLVAVSTLPYAALLLYGTRLLHPEERAHRKI